MKHVTPLLSSLLISLCAALIAGPSAGCGPATPQAEEPSVDRLAPTTLYPMEPGTQWVYDVDTGGGEPPTLGIFEVIEAVGHQRLIANNRGMTSAGQVRHGDPITYEITPDGIRHPSSGGWLLRAPLREGAEWDGMGGRTARVTDLDASVEVFAGTFEHCVEITETGGEDGRQVRTVYCPQVGPVLIESSMDMRLTTRQVATTARLRTHAPGGEE